MHLICLSLRTSDAEHHSVCFMAIVMTSLEKSAFIPWLIFFIGLFGFFDIELLLVVCMC